VRNVVLILPAKATPLVPGISVLRALPRRELRRVGPFVFFDHFGPKAPVMDVPAHPHVGLQTVTYLFSGAVRHRDSLGNEQIIRPGEVNWMTAGRGIVHAERGLPGDALHGIQTWIGLPQAHRRTDPSFHHLVADVEGPTRTIAGGRSPVPTFQGVTYLEVDVSGALELEVDPTHDLAVYAVDGELDVGGTRIGRGVLAHLSGDDARVELGAAGTRAVVIGGEPLPEPTVIYWNFVADSLAEGKAFHRDWQAGTFPRLPFADEQEPQNKA
jgi:redox-sensitive bicupin YhaK (pirin superfamily)